MKENILQLGIITIMQSILYLYNGYYVEVFYSPDSNKIDKIEVLENLKTLDLYIDHMNNPEKD